MRRLWQDLRHGARMLFRTPGFTATAVVTLALGIGANTAIFSVVNAVLLRPLPYPEPDRVVWLQEQQGGQPGFPFSAFELLSFREQNHTLEHIAAVRFQGYNLTGGDSPEHVQAGVVTPDLFSVLRVEPRLGRLLAAGADDLPSAPRVAVLGHAFWQQRFGGAEDVLGRTIRLNGDAATIVGVAPSTFKFGGEVAVWLNPRDVVPEVFPDFVRDPESDRGMHYLFLVGRLGKGVTLEQAQADLDTVSSAIRGETGSDHTIRLTTLEHYVTSGIRPTLLLLLVAVGFVLLIACANVANLLLARGAGRVREMAVRSALGAGRGVLVRQLLTEGLLLALAGGALGLVLAFWGLEALRALSPSELPRASTIRIDASVLLFTLGASVATSLLFGLVPALQLSGSDAHEALKEGGGRVSARNRVRSVLIAAEMALSLLLLASGGLLVRSFVQLIEVEPGFRLDNLATFRLSFAGPRYRETGSIARFVEELETRLASAPGVAGVGFANDLPLEGQDTTIYPQIEGRATDAKADLILTGEHVVNPGYFRTMGIPILLGRPFEAGDREGAPLVTIVNQAAAERFWPGADPIGRRLRLNRSADSPWVAVVGVAGNVRHNGLSEAEAPDLYLPFAQQPWPYAAVTLRSTTDVRPLMGTVRAEVAALDPDQPVFSVRTMDDVLSGTLGSRRFVLELVGGFAVLSLALASLGLYGVMAYLVTQRSREIGIRMALGARPTDIVRLVVGQGMRLTAAGILLGLAGSIFLTRFLTRLLYGIGTVDVLTLGVVAGVLASVAAAACYVPARRASRANALPGLRAD